MAFHFVDNGDSPENSSRPTGERAGSSRRHPWEWVIIVLGFSTVLFVISLIWVASHLKAKPQRGTEMGLVGTNGSSVQAGVAFQKTNQAAIHRENAPVGPRRIVQRVLAYGSGPGEVGMRRVPGETPVGPESYAIGPEGNILIADLVNHRIVVCGPDGGYLRDVGVPGINLNDLVVATNGTIIIYDQREHRLYAGDAVAGFTNMLTLNARDIDTRGYFHVVGDAVYFADAAVRDVLVASLDGRELRYQEPGIERQFKGIHGQDGRVYEVAITRGESVQVRISDPGQSTSRDLDLPLTDVVAARFIGTDRSGRFYLSTERLDSGRVSLEVIGFGPDGVPWERTRLADNDYAIWTAKLVESALDGQVIQFVPGEESAKINLLYAPQVRNF